MASQKEKAAYFRELYSLDNSDGEDAFHVSVSALPNIYSSSPQSAAARASLDAILSPVIQRQDPVMSLQRTQSEPISGKNIAKEISAPQLPVLLSEELAPSSAEIISEVGSSLPEANRPTTEPRTVSTPVIGSLILRNSTGINSMLGKSTKRGSSIKLVPEEQQIFKDLVFFYVRNDEKCSVRRIRMKKAREYGATWARGHARDWKDKITHVIVDKSISYKDAKSHLIEEGALSPSIIMVNEDYPIECTRLRALLDPNQIQYHVTGFSNSIADMATLQASEQPNASLEVKQSKRKRGDEDARQTPALSVESTQVLNEGQAAEPATEKSPPQALPDACSRKKVPLLADNFHDEPESLRDVENDVDSNKPSDALDEMIKVAKTVHHLPLDEYGEERVSSRGGPKDSDDDSGEEQDSSRSGPPPRKRLKASFKGVWNQENFTCMKGGTGATPNSSPNDDTIKILQEMSDFYDRNGDQWRPRAYRMAIGTLRKQETKIRTAEEAIKLPRVGERLASKIEEIVSTKELRMLSYAKMEPTFEYLQTFMGIYGVSSSHATQWVQQGYRTLDDLKARANLIQNQLLGIEHYDDFKTRIPREEVTALGRVVKDAVTALDPQVELIIGGSYRRGAKTSGDIDCLLTKKGTSSSQDLLPFLLKLVENLTKSGFLVAALATPNSEISSKWHGCCVLPGTEKAIWRRIDLLIVPESELGGALIYFTGDDIFNRSIRLLSSKKGMRLNQRGLYKDVMRGPQRVKLNDGALVEGAKEEKIFEALGVPWRPPEQRICH